MGSGFIYSKASFTQKNVKRFRFLRTFFFVGLLSLIIPLHGIAQSPPVFNYGSTVVLSGCNNVSIDLRPYLAVNSTGGNITWDVSTPPVFGSFSGFPFTSTWSSNPDSPAAAGVLTYMPDPTFSGTVTFLISADDGSGPNFINFSIQLNGAPTLTLGAAPVVCTGDSVALLSFSGVTGVGPISKIYNFLHNYDFFVVPTGISSLTFDVIGGGGGWDNRSGAPNPGKGGRVQGMLNVTPGNILNVFVGGQGDSTHFTPPSTYTDALGGWNGGGTAHFDPFCNGGLGACGGGGGGASDIRKGGTALSNRIIVAGGGAGNGWDSALLAPLYGGDAGGLTGSNSAANDVASFAGGGSQTLGGLAATFTGYPSGNNGVLGIGGNGGLQGVSGGGGGGYYGGGGGVWTGGGGGSSYTDPVLTSGVTHTPGYNSSVGSITVTYVTTGTYAITNWDAGAQSAGFANVLPTPLPGGGNFTIAIPPGTPAGTYGALLTIDNIVCSTTYPISITVNQTPNVSAVGNQVQCDGTLTTVNFASTVGAPSYDWVNNNSAIGIGTSGSGNISFTATNTTSGPLTGVFTVTPTQLNCSGAPTTFTITTNPLPGLTLGAFPQVCAGVTTATLPFTGLVNIGPYSNSFSYLGGNPAPQTFIVPAGIYSVTFDMTGGMGGSDDESLAPKPGKGGRIQGVINVTPSQQLSILVGGAGFNGSPFGAAGGFNGGGSASFYGGIGGTGCGGGGGGASDIRIGGVALTNRVAVAAGGGGSGFDNPVGAYAGGDGGGLIGANSATNAGGSNAGGGTQVTFGAGANYAGWFSGSNGASGMGGDGSVQGVSGGGGAGYYGGGGGIWTGGGGGSSYADPVTTTLVTYTPGFNIGHGHVTINYTTVGTYDLTWTGGAAGLFTDVTAASLPASAFTIAVPATAPSGIYTANLRIYNGICDKTYPITVTVNPLPDVIPSPDIAYCNTIATAAITFASSTIPTSKFYWTNDNTSIGLAASDSMIIPIFTATNASTVSQISNIIVTPIDSITGCAGAPDTFAITVNPTPTLSSSLNPPAICSAVPVNYFPGTADTAITTYTWSRSFTAGISTTGSTGSGNITETLVDTFTYQVMVPYVYTLKSTYSGCTNKQTVTVTMNPIPKLTNPLAAPNLIDPQNDTICSGTNLLYVPNSLTPGTTFTWIHDLPAGLTYSPISGVDTVNEVLSTISSGNVKVTYAFTMTAYGCSNGQNVVVIVKPVPSLSSAHTISSVCSGQDSILYHPTSATTGTIFNWNRIAEPGIIPGTFFGLNDIHDMVTNTTPFPIKVPYEYDLSYNGCLANPDTVWVTVNPIPKLTSPLNPGAIACSGSPIAYHATSSTDPFVTYAWVRPSQTGIKELFNSGSGDITETLTDTTNLSDTVIYIYTTKYLTSTCLSKDTVRIIVNPTPAITSLIADTAVCDSVGYTYVPGSSTPGATFTWSRIHVSGIDNPAVTGKIGNIKDTLTNSTNVNVTTTYTISVSANGCTGADKSFNITVHPDPKLASTHTPEYVCNGVPFVYYPSSYTPGTTFDWTRARVYGVNPLTNYGTGNVSEILYDSNYTQHTVIYNYRLTANGCTNLHFEQVKLIVAPGPRLPGMTTNAPLNPCSNTLFQTFGAAAPPANDITYDWYANNATLWSQTANHQYAYINFNYPGMSYVRLMGTIGTTGCKTTDSLFVNVGTGVADNPKVIFYQGEFICLQSNMDTYQWGYDDIATFASVALTGATMQNYYLPNPDLSHKRYWVITNHNGCIQKSYYNGPLGIDELNNGDLGEVKVYPNPTQDNINVEMNITGGGEMQVEVLNMLGQKLTMVPAINHKATIDVSNLPGGCYLVDCYRNGVKIATSRFIKN